MTTAGQSRPGLSRALLSISIGIALGSVLVSLYAFTRRVPDGLISDRLATATRFTAGSLIAAAVVATVLAGAAVTAWLGRLGAGKAATLLCLLCVVAAWCYLSTNPPTWTVAISGSDGRPVVALVQAAWLLLTVSAVFLVAGVVAAPENRQPFKWPAVLPFAAIGVALSLVAGYGLATLARVGASHPTTAVPIAIPDFPRTLGTKTAYTVPAESIDTLVPAGPGFVLADDDAVVAYDGTTGAERWRFPLTAFPDDCLFRQLRSTGSAPNAVVFAECDRSGGYDKPRRDSYLVGLDAMTGTVLWRLDTDWSLRGRVLLPADVVPVVNGKMNALGSLDPRTGSLRWTRSLDSLGQNCATTGSVTMAVDRTIIYWLPCQTFVKVLFFDAASGIERTAEHPVPQELTRDAALTPVASDGNVAIIEARSKLSIHSLYLRADERTGNVSDVPVPRFHSDVSHIGQYPGPVLQFSETGDLSGSSELYRLDDGSIRHLNGLKDFSSSILSGPHSGQFWAEVGDQMVTAAASDDNSDLLASVSRDGSYMRRSSPCGSDIGAVVSAPGAVLVICTRTKGGGTLGYDILGMTPG